MDYTSRRRFIQGGLAMAGSAAALPAAAQSQSATRSHTTLSSSSPPHASVKVIDTDAMPWPPAFAGLGWSVKHLYGSEDRTQGARLVIIKIPIGGPGGINHYHTFHEWAYWLTGDFVNNEYTDPYQRVGVFQQFREGVFLDRPPYSLHGGEPNRLDSQVGGTCLIMEEGGRTVSVIPDTPGYSEEFKEVKQWAVPRIVDTISDLPWEADAENPSHEGVFVKHLVDDQQRGFRATLWRLAAGWEGAQAPQFARAYYYRQAHQFNFVLNGDLRIQAYRTPTQKAELLELGKNFYCERPAMSIFGLADGVVSREGCVWLEVTYARGTSIPDIPIEDKTYV